MSYHTRKIDSPPYWEYTEIGRDLHAVKYKGDFALVNRLSEYAVNFLRTRWFLPKLSAILVVSPSDMGRDRQPVFEVAKEIGKKLGIRVDCSYIIKIKGTKPIKTIDDYESRVQSLRGAFRLRDKRYKGKRVLLFDDIYRSGATLSVISSLLYECGEIDRVYVLTLTKTRVKQ